MTVGVATVLVAVAVCLLTLGSGETLNFDAEDLDLRREIQFLQIDAVNDGSRGKFPYSTRIVSDSHGLLVGTRALPGEVGRGHYFAWLEGKLLLQNTMQPSTEGSDQFGAGLAIAGDWYIISGYNSQTSSGEIQFLSGSAMVQAILVDDKERYGQSLSFHESFLAVSSRLHVDIMKLESVSNWTVVSTLHLDDFQDIEQTSGSAEMTGFGDVSFGEAVALVAGASQAQPTALMLIRDGEFWRPLKAIGLSIGVNISPEDGEEDLVEEKLSDDDEAFEVSVATFENRGVIGCKNCFYRHSVLVVTLLDNGEVTTLELRVNNAFRFGAFPRRFGTKVALSDRFLVIADTAKVIQKSVLFEYSSSNEWEIVQLLYKPIDMFFLRLMEDVHITENNDVYSCGLQENSHTVLIYRDPANMTAPISDDVPEGGSGVDPLHYFVRATLTGGKKVAVGIITAVSFIVLAHTGLGLFRLLTNR